MGEGGQGRVRFQKAYDLLRSWTSHFGEGTSLQTVRNHSKRRQSGGGGVMIKERVRQQMSNNFLEGISLLQNVMIAEVPLGLTLLCVCVGAAGSMMDEERWCPHHCL